MNHCLPVKRRSSTFLTFGMSFIKILSRMGEIKIDIRSLQYSISIAEHLSLTEASKQLYVARPSVSQQIAGLERKWG